jgi:hypothetical protein
MLLELVLKCLAAAATDSKVYSKLPSKFNATTENCFFL